MHFEVYERGDWGWASLVFGHLSLAHTYVIIAYPSLFSLGWMGLIEDYFRGNLSNIFLVVNRVACVLNAMMPTSIRQIRGWFEYENEVNMPC